jgi:anti-sigma B factor antagonist
MNADSPTTYAVDVSSEPPTVVIRLTGQIDRDAASALTTAYDTASASNPQVVVLDFTEVDYINSTGIALVVGLLARARAEKRAVHAAGLTDHYRHVFEITRLSDFIQVFTDVDAALAATPS